MPYFSRMGALRRTAVLERFRVERSAAGSGSGVLGSVSSGCRGNTVGGLGSVHWREERISLLRFGYRTAQDVTGRHRGVVGPAMADWRRLKRDRFKTTGQEGDTVSATVLPMSEVRELWEVLHGA